MEIWFIFINLSTEKPQAFSVIVFNKVILPYKTDAKFEFKFVRQ